MRNNKEEEGLNEFEVENKGKDIGYIPFSFYCSFLKEIKLFDRYKQGNKEPKLPYIHTKNWQII